MQQIVINTGNTTKFEIAKSVLSEYNVVPVQQKIETPEIQSVSNKEICEYSARYAYTIIQQPVVVTDVGYYISALNGFPGPYVKYINKWLTADHILRMLEGVSDRHVDIIEYLTIALNSEELHTFSVILNATITDHVMDQPTGSTLDQLIIREGFDITQNLIPKDVLEGYFKKNVRIWHELGQMLKSH